MERTDDNVTGTVAYQAGFNAGEDGEPDHGDSSIVPGSVEHELWMWGWRDGRAWHRSRYGHDPILR